MSDPADLTAAPHVTAQTHVYNALRRMLMDGRVEPGERLVVRDLAERFETSAMPVREALRRLVAEDAVTDTPNRGVVVPQVTVEAVTDLVRIRCMIEGSAAEWAAATMTGREVAAVVAINDEMEARIEQGLTESYLALNRDFHFAIYRAARSDTLIQIIERLWLRAGPWLNVMREDATIRFGFEHHRDILAALRAGDGPRARQAVALDLSDAGEVILRRVAKAAAPAPSRKSPQ
ncbi:GntR family transcriptional regulator [Psychromarinibacter sp. C21-152]|uniref:GntR family transcriptional regulator n=1 Tax=Psychromarinibacter sediminicola TaxID=3033385 RepID=A0AAE3NPR5_9RHOB|nr:GntR family transcriptional regulator [Psychromarinibacter sediminicola]MDF0600199.1 GntR family transcriptional regulator [Psychromarinibacter sediminicola]